MTVIGLLILWASVAVMLKGELTGWKMVVYIILISLAFVLIGREL